MEEAVALYPSPHGWATCQGKINAIVVFCLENLEDVSCVLKHMDSDVLLYI
jgi:hypothetical protein